MWNGIQPRRDKKKLALGTDEHFWRVLALQFGYEKVSELKARLTDGEFLEWKIFYEIRPFGEEWSDARFAWLTAHIVSMLRKVDNVEDYRAKIYGREYQQKVQSAETQTAILNSLFGR